MKYYYELTKSGLVLGNLVTVVAGFLFGARVLHGTIGTLAINWWLFAATIIGITLVMASGCVFNNYVDRDIDIKMDRTKHRALVKEHVSGSGALVFSIAIGAIGFLILALFTNIFATLAAVTGFIFYVFAYTLWGKRNSVYGTFIGAIAGATPPVVGYAAASGQIDVAAAILFLIMLAWQMPHFFAIAIRRHEDYAAAGIPVMPVKHGLRRTKFSMLIYIIEFMLAVSLLFVFGYMGAAYLVIALALGFVWLVLGLRGFWINDSMSDANRRWARNMFFLSVIVMVLLFITIAVAAIA
jgi:protoheme IX farnesyltransferase